MEKEFLTEKELAARWNLMPDTLRHWRWDDKGPKYFKMSGRISYRISDVEAFEKDNEGTKLKDAKKQKKIKLAK